ncbi:ABC transporter substrate-binding protein [Halovivax limisalsi]|uniref:ABC transporter substrate-binding protein n=1 Tax=Halovivax limisalsi TaxID=1453760 RepID=UPI001FFD052D|nr:ABC transporter substrate-binding protein [Halovivax limisalsi]
MTSHADGPTVSRRSALQTAAVGTLAATSGCVREVRNIVRREPDRSLSLSIATLPEDADPPANALAKTFESALSVAGIDVEVAILSPVEYRREILLNHEFDTFVGPYPTGIDPEYLYESFHSRYAEESGWQNPFGLTNLRFDEQLEAQRSATDTARVQAVTDGLFTLANEQPLTPLCRPTEHRLVNADRFTGWDRHPLTDRLFFAALEPEADVTTLRGLLTDPRVTQNLNPFSIEYRDGGLVIDLLYDSLAARDGDGYVPWLAEDWEWDGSVATVTLRDATWHDGEPVTASDVVFTHDFLEDMALGSAEVPAPAPIYRGRASAIESVEASGAVALELVAAGGIEAAESALTVPIFPEHVWADRTEEASLPGIETPSITEGVVTDNVPPVGSGCYRFEDRTDGELLTLARNDEHFSRSAPTLPTPTIETLRFEVVSNSSNAAEAVRSGLADVTLSMIEPRLVDGLAPDPPASILETEARWCYCIGYNARSGPLGNPNFRQVIASLVDKAHLVDAVFDGHATPIVSPLSPEWVPSALRWRGRDPVTPFLGRDGELDTDAVRRAFDNIGYRYDEDGSLLTRN